MEKTFYLETGSTDPAYNLAFEEYVLTHRREGSYLILWQNENAVIVGRNQNAEAEINRSFVEEHGIRVIRRNSGGGTVYHDLGNLNYSFITDVTAPDQQSAAAFTAPVVCALQALGLHAECSGRNDILVAGRKVSGTAQQHLHGRILHHGTLLFDTDPAMIAGALNPDPEKFRSKGVASVRSRVGSIRAALPADMTIDQFWAHLKKNLSTSGIQPCFLTEQELEAVLTLKQEKYDTWEWNFGRSPQYQSCFRHRWPGGTLEVHLSVTRGKISDADILGDFLGREPVDMLTQLLIGCPYREEYLRSCLQGFPLEACLGGITLQQLLATILNKSKEPG